MTKRRLYVLSLFLALAALGITLRSRLRQSFVAATQTIKGKKTAQQRVEEYGPAVRERLLPYFQAAKILYPPPKVTFAALKHEKRLEVWAAGDKGRYALIRTYLILGSSGRLGPKLKQGDLQVPEGLYRIESLNPNSMFHLSLRLNYPNQFDRRQAKRDKRGNLGGDIMIHGSNVSIGCLAMGDEAVEDLFVLAAEIGIDNISVILSPVDFRKRDLPKVTYPLPEWTEYLYGQIKQELSKLKS